MQFLAGLLIGGIVGYLDPIVMWRKCNTWGEEWLFPKISDARTKWREEVEKAKALKEEQESLIDKLATKQETDEGKEERIS